MKLLNITIGHDTHQQYDNHKLHDLEIRNTLVKLDDYRGYRMESKTCLIAPMGLFMNNHCHITIP